VEHLVFVYGTLKEGFRNFHINHGKRLPGEFVTVRPHALLIVGEFWLPWLLEEARAQTGSLGNTEGHPVIGQVYALDDAALAEMDKLEQIDEAGWYLRRRIDVRPRDAEASAGPELRPWVYFGSREGLASGGKHLGPLPEYTLAHQELLPRALWDKG
jgi:gamma-glutamylaminecyclotransferase